MIFGERAFSSNPAGCVVAGSTSGGQISLRSNRREGTILIDPDEWELFIQAVRNGECDLVDGRLPDVAVPASVDGFLSDSSEGTRRTRPSRA